MSATHSSFGLKALKCLLTRSAGHCSRGALRVVRGDLASDSAQAQVAHEAFDGAPGHVTGTVTLGDLGSVEHYMYLAGP